MSSSVQKNTNRLIEVNHNNNNNYVYIFFNLISFCALNTYCHKFVVSNKIKFYTYKIVYIFLIRKKKVIKLGGT